MSQSSNKLDVTGVILTHAKTAKLQAAIDSLEWTRQIIVIDTSQTGECKDIENKRILVKQHPTDWQNVHFAKIRNQALELVKTQWAFFLDSDEIATEELARAVENFLQAPSASAHVSTAQFKRVDFFLGKRLKYGEVGNV